VHLPHRMEESHAVSSGHGCLLDYFNPAALAWWHSQLDLLLDHGADGWKIDGTDPFILELVAPRSYGGRCCPTCVNRCMHLLPSLLQLG
jgi:hypothetical protein